MSAADVQTIRRALINRPLEYQDFYLRAEEALARLEALALRGERVINCDHNQIRDDFNASDLWEYVQHEGKTWNRCRGCGLLELWEGGQFFRAALVTPEEGAG